MTPKEPAAPADDKKPAAAPTPPHIDLDESVAGEEDPGAGLDQDFEPPPRSPDKTRGS